jgi:fructokinase
MMMNAQTNTYQPLPFATAKYFGMFCPMAPSPAALCSMFRTTLNKLGMPTSLVSKIGNDADGQKLEKLLDNWGIKNICCKQIPNTQPAR